MKESKSLQEVFTTAVVHLLRQNERSAYGSACQYRRPNGAMCAVGKLIDKEAYCPSIEGHAVGSMDVQAALLRSGVDTCVQGMLPLLAHLQCIHDDTPIEFWPKTLANLASMFNLSMPNLDALLASCTAVPVELRARLLTEVNEEELAL